MQLHKYTGSQACQGDAKTTQFTIPIPTQPDVNYRLSFFFTADDAEDVWGSVSVPIVSRAVDSFILKFQDPPGVISFQVNWSVENDG